jgi:hypothetical protein
MKARVLVVAVVAVLVAAPAGARSERVPTIRFNSATVKRTAVRDGYAGTVSVNARICVGGAPGPLILTTQTRRMGGKVKARLTTRDPLAVDSVDVLPYTCVDHYRVAWVVQSRFMVGGGTYTASLRIRNGSGVLSAPATVSLTL